MRVLFTSTRPLGRCENLTAVWNAYQGDKEFAQIGFGDASSSECNVIVTDEFLERVDKPRQKVIMIAHGLTGGKLYGNDQPQGIFYGKADSTGLVDYYVVSSEHGRQFAASASGIPIERCLPLGMPRTDAYFGKKKGDGGTVLSKYKRAYLYAPTFRAWYNKKIGSIDWPYINAMLEDDEILAVKRHMVINNTMLDGVYDHIIEIDNNVASTPYLIDCDVLITDFSSILFDGYVLGKPSVLATDEMENYLSTRGMYMDYPREYGSRCGNISQYPATIIEHARAAVVTGMRGVEQMCKEKTASACDGHSTERVIELVEKLLCES